MRKVINELLRVAICIELKSAPRGFEVKSYDLKLKAGYDPLSLNSLYDELELDNSAHNLTR